MANKTKLKAECIAEAFFIAAAYRLMTHDSDLMRNLPLSRLFANAQKVEQLNFPHPNISQE